MPAPAGTRSAKIPAACLLTIVGGYLDAYSYLGHGGIFANAQSGNVVLLGIGLAQQNWHLVRSHIPPILAYVVGAAATAAILDSRSPDEPRDRATAACLLFEAACLVILAAIGQGLANVPAVTLISVLAAIQSASFAKVDGLTYNSAVTTGNLRSFAKDLAAVIAGQDRAKNLHAALVLAAICISFLAGAWLGALLTPPLGGRALLPAALAVTAVAATLWKRTDVPG
jgi:uncharacterized membrane protein YoaK (UPF0700 family)